MNTANTRKHGSRFPASVPARLMVSRQYDAKRRCFSRGVSFP